MSQLLFNPMLWVVSLIGTFLYRYGIPGPQEYCGKRVTAKIEKFEEVRLGSLLGTKAVAPVEDIADVVFLDWFATWLSEKNGVTKLVIGWDTYIDAEEVRLGTIAADRQFYGPIKFDPDIRTVGDFIRNLERSTTPSIYGARLCSADRPRYTLPN